MAYVCNVLYLRTSSTLKYILYSTAEQDFNGGIEWKARPFDRSADCGCRLWSHFIIVPYLDVNNIRIFLVTLILLRVAIVLANDYSTNSQILTCWIADTLLFGN